MAPALDDDIHNKILAFVTEQKACLSCHAWKDYLYESLQLQLRIRFNQRLANGPVTFSYNAVRPLGEDFEESVNYNFEFRSDGKYYMQWARTFDAWSSQSEQHYGSWTIDKDDIHCETLDPKGPVNDMEVRYANAGHKFSVSIDDILSANGTYFQAQVGCKPKSWERPARLGVEQEADISPIMIEGQWQPTEVVPAAVEVAPAAVAAAAGYATLRADARFVDIDGEMHEVSGDIVNNWPEGDWARLMKCRLRFGIN